ncbi:MAG: hypothetical protein ACR2KE_05425 [Candidatus Nanopelagicales bacterium]
MSDTPQEPGGPAEPPLSGEPDITRADLPPLDPDLAAWFAGGPAPAMPPEVWSRIEVALAAEPPFTPGLPGDPAPEVAVAASVSDLGAHRARRSRVLPILAGAAGVVLVGAVVIPSMRAGDAPTPVADGGSPAAVAATNPSVMDSTATRAQAEAVAMPRMMMSTGTQYASAQMPTQVSTLLSTAGISTADQVIDMATAEPPVDVSPVGTEGFTASEALLADCLARLGMSPDAMPTLIIDRATYDGQDAGVILAMKESGSQGETPAVLDVVVIGAQCTDDDVARAQHFEYAVTP